MGRKAETLTVTMNKAVWKRLYRHLNALYGKGSLSAAPAWARYVAMEIRKAEEELS